jgi:hypothetical protein
MSSIGQINNIKVSPPQLSLDSLKLGTSNDVSEVETLVSTFPKVALKNQVIASLFRHYIDFLTL